MRSTFTLSVGNRTEDDATLQRVVHVGLLVVEAFVALTAIAGGSALVLGALLPQTATILNPPDEYLAGTPFTSYVIPGLLLAVVVGGLHVVAFVLELMHKSWHALAAATAGFTVLIWIFVQMIFIPFSFLQAVYFVAGLAELGLVMLVLGITRVSAADTWSATVRRR